MAESPNLTIRQLRAFVAVAELESFRRAGLRLSLTSGAISLLIRELESQLGFKVFDRTTRTVALSRAGRSFLPSAQTVLRQMQAATMAANDLRQGALGAVRVAAPLVLASSLLPHAIAEYQSAHPDVMFRPIDCANEQLVETIENDDADIAIGPDQPASAEVQRTPIIESPWMLWCAAEHRLARKRKIRWQDLAGESVIAVGRDYETHLAETLNQLERTERFTPSYVVDNITTAFGLAGQGLGVTLAPHYVGVLAKLMGLVMKRIEEPALLRELSLYTSTRRAPTAAVEGFKAFLIAHLANQL
ncbi:MAG: LysR family transcriptional regulator [Burkholderiaceae bacterium]